MRYSYFDYAKMYLDDYCWLELRKRHFSSFKSSINNTDYITEYQKIKEKYEKRNMYNGLTKVLEILGNTGILYFKSMFDHFYIIELLKSAIMFDHQTDSVIEPKNIDLTIYKFAKHKRIDKTDPERFLRLDKYAKNPNN